MTSVLVVDDSQFMRTVIGNILADHGYEVFRANDGEQAVEVARKHEPDVVTMDVQMPGMGGIEAVGQIMRTAPARILMLSAHTEEGADATLQALSHGAIDFFQKPGGEVSPDITELEDRLVKAVETVEQVDVTALAPSRAAATVRAIAGDSGVTSARQGSVASAGRGDGNDGLASPGTELPKPTVDDDRPGTEDDPDGRTFRENPTVVVGASTGGPKVLEQIMYDLPLALDARVLIVQHMPEDFTGRLSTRLDSLSAYDISEATDGDRVSGGEALIARGNRHMEVSQATDGHVRVRLSDDERIHGVRPAIDVTMETAADRVDSPLAGVVLTGMGKDGARGISAIKGAGGTTFAQDRETSPVFGIPRQAIDTGDVDHVLPATDVTDGVLDAFSTEVDTDG